MPNRPAIIVIGASAGGVDALVQLVASLPADLPAAVFIVLHVGAHHSTLPKLLSNNGPLPATHARDGQAITPGHIHVAPPDHHMIIEDGHVQLTKGPRENSSRPAIDPLFRSAARSHGARVVGVILTGGLNDGTAGLYEIKRSGGRTVVQDPADCLAPNMPLSAIANVEIDHVAAAADIGTLLARLVHQAAEPAPIEPKSVTGDAQGRGMTAEFTDNPPIAVTCPDCGGALRRSALGSLTQFSCHIGHVYTAEVMLAAQFLTMERFIEQALRALHERAELCRQEAGKYHGTASTHAASQRWRDAQTEAMEQSEHLQSLLQRAWIHPELAPPPLPSTHP